MKILIMKNIKNNVSVYIIKTLVLIAFIWGTTFHSCFAQKTEIKLDTNNILLGDQIHLIISITLPENAHVDFPVLADTLTKDIEIVHIGKIDTASITSDKMFKYSQDITITAFDSGYFVIPPLRFIYTFSSDTAKMYAETEAMLLEVKKVQINEQEDIKDLKDIFGAPLTFKEILPYLLIGILVLVLVYLGIWLWKKYRKKEKLFFIKKPQLPPHIEALQALEALKNKKLWKNNFVKEYYSELTDIIRLYLERAFNINALEMTTEEIKTAILQKQFDEYLKIDLRHVLEISDLVKFAKYLPISTDHENCFNKCLFFVKETSPKDNFEREEKEISTLNKMSSESENNNEKPE